MFDVLVRGGTVIDGGGKPGFAADVAISGERIADVGRLGGATARTVIDAAGLVVCPGFIDTHVHGDAMVLEHVPLPVEIL